MTSFLRVCANQPDHHRHRRFDVLHRSKDAAGNFIAARDAAKDVEQHGFDIRVRKDNAHRGSNFLCTRTTADIQEVGRFTTKQLDDVHASHRKSGTVDHATDVAVQLDERKSMPARFGFGGRFFVGIAYLRQSEEHTSELPSPYVISYAGFFLQ